MKKLLTYFFIACTITLFTTSCEPTQGPAKRKNPVDQTSWTNKDKTIILEFKSDKEAVLTVQEASGSVELIYPYEYITESLTAEMRYPTNEYPDFDARTKAGTINLTNLSTGMVYAILYPN